MVRIEKLLSLREKVNLRFAKGLGCILVLWLWVGGWATQAQSGWRFQMGAGSGVSFQQVTTDAVFNQLPLEIHHDPLVNTTLRLGHFFNDEHGVFVGWQWNRISQKFKYGPTLPSSGTGLWVFRDVLRLSNLSSLQVGYERVLLPLGKWGELSATASILYTQHHEYTTSRRVPYSTFFQLTNSNYSFEIVEEINRLQNLGMGLGARWSLPGQEGPWRFFVETEYHHYFTPWHRLYPEYFEIYQVGDPNTVVAEPDFLVTTYLRNLAFNIGIEYRLFAKVRSPHEVGKSGILSFP